MDINALIARQHDCIADAPPACSRACPLGLDVRAFIDKLRSGLPAAAYKTFRKFTEMPGVACHLCGEPCRGACVRADVDEAISIKRLEQFCWQENRGKRDQAFHINDKKKHILVVGGGPSGLSCASRMAGWGYRVTLVEAQNRLGGRLWDVGDAVLPKDVLQEDIERIISLEYLEVKLGQRIDAADLGGYDAVLIAAGQNGQKLSEAVGDRAGVFRTGALLHPGQDLMGSLQQGGQIAQMLEDYTKVQRVIEREDTASDVEYIPDVSGAEPQPCALPDDPSQWKKQTAMDEANRCLRCSCSRCYDVCEMLAHYKRDAKMLMDDTNNTLNKFFMNKNRALAPVMSCTQCGACKAVCPVDIDLGLLCVQTRRILHQRGKLPDAHFDYWMNDMRHANSDEASILLPGDGEPGYVFFPGCQMGASNPDYVADAYSWLTEAFPGTAAMVGCCGAPAYWAGVEEEHARVLEGITEQWLQWDKPTFVLACPTCVEMFAEHLPNIQATSLWKLMDEQRLRLPANGKVVSIFDPCASKTDGETQAAIRALINGMGYVIMELDYPLDEARCCGYGGHIYTYNTQLMETISEHNN